MTKSNEEDPIESSNEIDGNQDEKESIESLIEENHDLSNHDLSNHDLSNVPEIIGQTADDIASSVAISVWNYYYF